MAKINDIVFFGLNKSQFITMQELVYSLTEKTKQMVDMTTCKKYCKLSFDRDFNEHDFENEDEGENLQDPYFVRFERFCANVAKLRNQIECDVAFNLNFEYTRKSNTHVSEMNVWYDSREDNKIHFTKYRLAGSWSVGHYFLEEFDE